MNHEADSFVINGHVIEVEFKPISSEGMGSIREQIRKDDFFGAELRAIVNGVEELKHDSKLIIRKRNRAERRAGASLGDAEGIPNDYDAQTDDFLWDILLKKIVAREAWLANRAPFKEIFEQYAEEPKKDPTPLRVEAKTGT